VRGAAASGRLQSFPSRLNRSTEPVASRYNDCVEFIVGLLLLAALVVAWVARRRARTMRASDARRRRRQRRSADNRSAGPNTVSPRSDMRATDSPATVADTIRKRHKGRSDR